MEKGEMAKLLLDITIHSRVAWDDSEDSLSPQTRKETIKEGGPIVGWGGFHGT